MFWRIFFKTILFFFLASLQLFFASALPVGWREIEFLIIFLVFYLDIDSERETIWWFFAVGLIFGLYHSFHFWIFLLAWPLAFVFCHFLYSNVLTNRSLYSFLGLAAATSFFYRLVLNSLVYLEKIIFGEPAVLFLLSWDFWKNSFWMLALNSVFIAVLFYLVNQTTNRLKPMFIFRKK